MREAVSRGIIQRALALMPANTKGYLNLLKNEGVKTVMSERRNKKATEETTSTTTHIWK